MYFNDDFFFKFCLPDGRISSVFSMREIADGKVPEYFRDGVIQQKINRRDEDGVSLFVGDIVIVKLPNTLEKCGRGMTEVGGETFIAIIEWCDSSCSAVLNECRDNTPDWAHHYIHDDLSLKKIGCFHSDNLSELVLALGELSDHL